MLVPLLRVVLAPPSKMPSSIEVYGGARVEGRKLDILVSVVLAKRQFEIYSRAAA